MSYHNKTYYNLEQIQHALPDDVRATFDDRLSHISEPITKQIREINRGLTSATRSPHDDHYDEPELKPSRGEQLTSVLHHSLDLSQQLVKAMHAFKTQEADEVSNLALAAELEKYETLDITGTQKALAEYDLWITFPEAVLLRTMKNTFDEITDEIFVLNDEAEYLFRKAEARHAARTMTGSALADIINTTNADDYPQKNNLLRYVNVIQNHLTRPLDDMAKMYESNLMLVDTPNSPQHDVQPYTSIMAGKSSILDDMQRSITDETPRNLHPGNAALFHVARALARQSRSALEELRTHINECYETLGIDTDNKGRTA